MALLLLRKLWNTWNGCFDSVYSRFSNLLYDENIILLMQGFLLDLNEFVDCS